MIIKAKSYFATPFLQMSFSGILSLSHPRASIARPGDLRIFGSSPAMTEERKSAREWQRKEKQARKWQQKEKGKNP
ncbi:MAG: hypothetical protein EGQ57_08090 [Alphaproteobacteria bacterium]|nr:hypothetical protein [Alphaproteobacteria bacterium]